MSYREYYKDDDQLYGIQEEKRNEQQENNLFGVGGTFRKLAID